MIAKVICLTKNEYDLIEDFILFYSSIFGMENIIIIDNGSDERIHEIYKTYEGITVHNETRCMQDMSVIMTEYMNKYKDSCDFLIPLDTDEFMFLDGSIFNTQKILKYLEFIKSDEEVSVIKYNKFYGSLVNPEDDGYVDYKYERPTINITRFYNQGWDKVIVRSTKFVSIGQGNHNVEVTDGITITGILSLLHFHNTGPKREFERCVQSIIGYRFFDANLPIDVQMLLCPLFIEKPGGHRVRQHISYIKRMFIINTIRKVSGCETMIPNLNLVNTFSELDNPYEIYSEILKNINLVKEVGNNDAHNIRDLLYYKEKETKDEEFTVTQVKDYLLSIKYNNESATSKS